MKIGINKLKDKINFWKLLFVILLRSFEDIKPHDDMVVNAKFTDSKNLIFDNLNSKIIKIVEKKYIDKILRKL